MPFTPEAIVKSWEGRSYKVQGLFRELVNRTGRRMLQVSKEHMRKQIYAIPEDKDASGRKKWVRTRKLIEAETLVYAPNRSAVALTNAMIYARSRHELGRDGRKTKRPAHWRDGIFQELEEEVRTDMATTLFRVRQG